MSVSTFGCGVESYWKSTALEILRHGEGGDEVVLEPTAFSDGEIDGVEVLCKEVWESDQGICDDQPEECEDCDEDGVPECYGSCVERYWIGVVDECAPPGYPVYQLLCYSGSGGGTWEDDEAPYDCGVWAARVEDSGDACLDGEGGCGVVGVGRDPRSVGVALWLFLAGIGLFALRRGARG